MIPFIHLHWYSLRPFAIIPRRSGSGPEPLPGGGMQQPEQQGYRETHEMIQRGLSNLRGEIVKDGRVLRQQGGAVVQPSPEAEAARKETLRKTKADLKRALATIEGLIGPDASVDRQFITAAREKRLGELRDELSTILKDMEKETYTDDQMTQWIATITEHTNSAGDTWLDTKLYEAGLTGLLASIIGLLGLLIRGRRARQRAGAER